MLYFFRVPAEFLEEIRSVLPTEHSGRGVRLRPRHAQRWLETRVLVPEGVGDLDGESAVGLEKIVEEDLGRCGFGRDHTGDAGRKEEILPFAAGALGEHVLEHLGHFLSAV